VPSFCSSFLLSFIRGGSTWHGRKWQPPPHPHSSMSLSLNRHGKTLHEMAGRQKMGKGGREGSKEGRAETWRKTTNFKSACSMAPSGGRRRRRKSRTGGRRGRKRGEENQLTGGGRREGIYRLYHILPYVPVDGATRRGGKAWRAALVAPEGQHAGLLAYGM